MKKKLAVLGLAATMMMSLFAGCGGKGTSGGKDASADKGSVYYLNFKPEADAQCEHVLALDDGLVVESGLFQRLARHGGDVGNDDVVFVELEFCQRIEGCESRLLEMFFGDRIAVEDDRRARLEPLSVGLERRGVHRHQHIAVVTGIQLAVVAEMDLEARNARNGSLRGADFGGVVGEGRDAVSQQRRSVGKERARELHAVARIARKADHDVLQLPHF